LGTLGNALGDTLFVFGDTLDDTLGETFGDTLGDTLLIFNTIGCCAFVKAFV
jgi:hypothetical protein